MEALYGVAYGATILTEAKRLKAQKSQFIKPAKAGFFVSKGVTMGSMKNVAINSHNARNDARAVISADHKARVAMDGLLLKIRKNAIDLQGDIQLAAQAAMLFYALAPEHETCYITRLVNVVDNSRGLNGARLRDYLLSLSPGLVHKRAKDGNMIVAHDRRKPKPTPEELGEKMLSVAWHQYRKAIPGAGAKVYAAADARADLVKFAGTTMRKLGPTHAMTRAEWLSACAAAYDAQLRAGK